MLTLFLLAAVLAFAIGALIVLGVEDAKFHESYTPVHYQASPLVFRWDESLPGKPKLPWTDSESEGK